MSTLNVNTIANLTGTTAATIDSAGRILQPLKPHIFCQGNNNNWVTHTANDAMTWLTVQYSSGMAFTSSSGNFSGQVAGVYFVTGSIYATGAGSKRLSLMAGTNSGTLIANGHNDPTNSDDGTITVSAIVNLASSDTFKFVLPYAHQVYQGNAHCYASAYLIN